jgi:prepilin-type N-terminal cleavage/methylation domain-containing protein
MSFRRIDERGDTLLEVLIALVIIGLVVGAFFASFTTASAASTQQRNLVTADGILRNYAEAVKTAVRDSCNNFATYTPAYTSPDATFVLSPDPTTPQTCPPVSGPLAQQVPTVHLSVTLPSGTTKSLDIAVRTP